MISIKVDSRGAQKYLGEAAKQIKFATAVALNRTAKLAVADAKTGMMSAFKNTNNFTRNALEAPRSLAATKDRLSAVVWIKPQQARYLGFEILGGTRTGADSQKPSQALVMAGSGKQALPSGFVQRIAAQAAAELGRREAVRMGTRKGRRGTGNKGIFLMSGGGPVGSVGGYFKRLPGHHLQRLVAFEAAAKYSPRWDFFGQVTKSAARNFPREFEVAMQKALATAKK